MCLWSSGLLCCGGHPKPAYCSGLSRARIEATPLNFRPRGLEGWSRDKLGTRPPVLLPPLQRRGRLPARAGHRDQGGTPPPQRVGRDHVPGTLITEQEIRPGHLPGRAEVCVGGCHPEGRKGAGVWAPSEPSPPAQLLLPLLPHPGDPVVLPKGLVPPSSGPSGQNSFQVPDSRL